MLGDNFDIDQFACFVPRTVLEAIADNRIRYAEEFDIIVENFNAAVVRHNQKMRYITEFDDTAVLGFLRCKWIYGSDRSVG